MSLNAHEGKTNFCVFVVARDRRTKGPLRRLARHVLLREEIRELALVALFRAYFVGLRLLGIVNDDAWFIKKDRAP